MRWNSGATKGIKFGTTEITKDTKLMKLFLISVPFVVSKIPVMCNFLHMPTNLAIHRRERKKILKEFGKVDYYEDYKPKQYRSR